MIDIRIDGHSLDLFPDTAYTLERSSPLFDFDTVQGAKVYPFEVPSTPRNRQILGYFHLPQMGYDQRRYRCEKYVFSHRVEQGYVMVSGITEKGFSVFYTQNLGEIFGDRQSLRLSDMVDLGSEAVPASPLANPDLSNAQTRLFWPTVLNPSFYGNTAPGGFAGRMNDYNAGTGQYATNGRVPMILMRWVMARFGQLTGSSFEGTWWSDPLMQRLLFYNQFSVDGASAITYTNHLPEWSMRDALMNLRRLFNLYLEFDTWNKILTIDYGRDVINTQLIDDWTERAVPSPEKRPDPASRLNVGYEVDSNDLLMTPIPTAHDRYLSPDSATTPGIAATTIRSGFSTLRTDTATGLASIQQAGISSLNKESSGRGTPKLLFWNGVVGGLPRASNTHGATSLVWSGPNNLVDQYWKNYEQLKAGTWAVKQGVFMSPSDLASFSFRRKIHIRGVNYLVAGLRAGISMHRETIPCELDLWRC